MEVLEPLLVPTLDPLLLDYAKKRGIVSETTYVSTGPYISTTVDDDMVCIIGMGVSLLILF